ncbi:nitroreductase family protein [Janthinobacterium sp. HLX7-2]|uniref:nitroreductase family protein n=1 Tax=Janthinobacterium sp. HLX7-2 TaxID=1259331 RepID=UPI003F2121DA
MSNINEIITSRTSASNYDATRKLSKAEIAELVALATQAPSAFNLQNWKFIAVESDAAKASLLPLAYSQPKITDAAVTFIICGTLDPHVTLPAALKPTVDAGIITEETYQGWLDAVQNMYGNNPVMARDEAVRSASLAAMTLMLAAQGKGLVSCPMIGFDAAGVAAQLELPATEIPVMMITVGYAAPGNWAKKPRKAVDSVLSFL